MKVFDWHRDPITNDRPNTASYRNTQNVGRFFRAQCGADFKFDPRRRCPPCDRGVARRPAVAEASEGWVFFDRGLIDAAAALAHLTGAPVIERVIESVDLA